MQDQSITPCCGRPMQSPPDGTISLGDRPCVFYDEVSKVVRCHLCGTAYAPTAGTVEHGLSRIRTLVAEALGSIQSDYSSALPEGYYTERSDSLRREMEPYKNILSHIKSIQDIFQKDSLPIYQQVMGDSGGRYVAKMMEKARTLERLDIVDSILHPPGRLPSNLRSSLDELANAIKSGTKGWSNVPSE